MLPWFPHLWSALEHLGAGHACTWHSHTGLCYHLQESQLASPHFMEEMWELLTAKPPTGGHTQGTRTHKSESSLHTVPGPHLLAPSPQAHRPCSPRPPSPVDKLLSNKTKKPHAAKCGIAPSEPEPSHHHGNSAPSPYFPTWSFEWGTWPLPAPWAIWPVGGQGRVDRAQDAWLG